MTTLDGVPTIGEYVMARMQNARRNRAQAITTARSGNRAWFLVTVRVMLHLAGFSALTIAGFEWHKIAGWCAVMVSCFVLSHLFTTSDQQDNQTTMRR